MTPSKSGSRTEERGRGISNAGRPFRSPRTVGLLPFSIRRSPPWLRPAPTRRLCGGQIPVTVPVGRSIYARRRAQTRSHPLADPLLPSGGPIRPASYGWLSCACGAIRFCSARRTAPPLALFAVAQPILSAMFGSQRAALAIRSLPLARSLAPAPRAPWWALPPRPEASPVPQPKGNRAEAVSAAGPSLAGPTPATSFDGRTA